MWLVTFAALFAAALAVGATSATTVLGARSEIGLMKALGASRARSAYFFLPSNYSCARWRNCRLRHRSGIGASPRHWNFRHAPPFDWISSRSCLCWPRRGLLGAVPLEHASRVDRRPYCGVSEDVTPRSRSMFWRIFRQRASREPRAATVALIALSSGARFPRSAEYHLTRSRNDA